MTDKPGKPARKPPAAPLHSDPGGGRRPVTQVPAPATGKVPDSGARWQRTIRYNWDKGGSRGGRR